MVFLAKSRKQIEKHSLERRAKEKSLAVNDDKEENMTKAMSGERNRKYTIERVKQV